MDLATANDPAFKLVNALFSVAAIKESYKSNPATLRKAKSISNGTEFFGHGPQIIISDAGRKVPKKNGMDWWAFNIYADDIATWAERPPVGPFIAVRVTAWTVAVVGSAVRRRSSHESSSF
jgi:hypothetical protein